MGNLDLTGLSQQEKAELLNRLQADLKRSDFVFTKMYLS